MSPFRRVSDERAGAAALGILVPPARRTVVILRPRALAWDLLLLCRNGGADGATVAIHELGRDEAAAAARRLFHALEAWSAAGRGRMKVVPSPDGAGYWVQAEAGEFALIACPRLPGQPYRPTVFVDLDEAKRAALSIGAVLCPEPDAEQEFYFNTQNFQSVHGKP
jgi:hypothetical protein